MPNLLAAFGVAQLENIEEFIKIKRDNATYYNDQLQEISGVTIPVEKDWAYNCYWLYSVVIEDSYGITRDELIQKLREKGIESRPFFMPIHSMPPYEMCTHGNLEVTEELYNKGINLPSSVGLTRKDIDLVCEAIREFGKGK